MELLSDIFDFLSTFDAPSQIDLVKSWGDKIWSSLDDVHNGTLSFVEITIDYTKKCI